VFRKSELLSVPDTGWTDPDTKAFLKAKTTETLVASALTVQELAVGEILARNESKERVL
jgi:hypothetical protein